MKSTLRNLLRLSASVLVGTWGSLQNVEAWPASPGIYGAATAPTTCPNGLSYVAYDGCTGASVNAQFKQSNMVATYTMDASGNPATINHIGPFNKAGIDFGVGMINPTLTDLRGKSVAGTASITGSTLTWTAITNGGVPGPGMVAWDDASGGHVYYTDQPTINGACTGSSPNYVCPLNKSETNHGSVTMNVSAWPGCVETNGTSTTNDAVLCKFGGSSSGFTATFDQTDFGATNGHNATVLSTTVQGGGPPTGHVVITNSHLAIDQYSDGNNVISAGIAAPNVSLYAANIECDGGNAGVPLTGPYTFAKASSCINWAAPGTSGTHNLVTIINPYVHDWAANPFNFQSGYVDVLEQSPVFIRVNLNCGNGGTNVCHGAPTQFGTTLTGSSGATVINNITFVYPYGFQNGAVTAAVAALGGVNSALNLGLTVRGVTGIANVSNFAGHSTLSSVVEPFRLGALSSIIVQHMYVNGPGIASCFLVGADLQDPSVATGSMSPNTGLGTSTMTWSGFSGQVPIPFPGQTVVLGPPSGAIVFGATLTDNGNGTSTMTISGTPPATIAAKKQVVALQLTSITAHPTLVVSGSGSSYIVSNGSGSGENQPSEVFTVAQAIIPPPTTDPNTGLPTTATFGTTTATYNGTMLVGGEVTQSATNTWSANSVGIGNAATIQTDVSDNWEMETAGSAGAITVDGIQLDHGQCPNTLPG